MKQLFCPCVLLEKFVLFIFVSLVNFFHLLEGISNLDLKWFFMNHSLQNPFCGYLQGLSDRSYSVVELCLAFLCILKYSNIMSSTFPQIFSNVHPPFRFFTYFRLIEWIKDLKSFLQTKATNKHVEFKKVRIIFILTNLTNSWHT